mmetsp:Transcript_934/g.1634  ORF Transcript_934/g.1634 Transcript_934/m.1634 type:complete len:585 (-) Transcript_934:1451-3205(-)
MSYFLDGVEAQISRMNLSPTSSPNSRRRQEATNDRFNISVTAVSAQERRDHHLRSNTTPQRQQESHLLGPGSYMSPRNPPAPPVFIRAHSSPSMIDSSPKTKGQKRLEPSPTCVAGPDFPVVGSPTQAYRSAPGSNQISELTPVASNMARETCTISLNDDVSANMRDLDQLSVPQTQSLGYSAFRRSSYSNLDSRGFAHTSRIHPRHDHLKEEEEEEQGNGPNELDLGPINPASWLQQSSSSRFPNHGTVVGSQLPTRGVVHVSHQNGLDQHPRNFEIVQSLDPQNRVPYQPTRESRLTSFGIVRDDAESIFHSNVDSTCRSGQQTSESHDVDDTDFSVPSLRLATQLRSNTYDSYTTISGDDMDSLMMEEESVVILRNASYEEPQWGCFPNMSMAAVLDPGAPLPSAASNNRIATRVKSSGRDQVARRRSSGVMSPEKEREVFDWLHSLEVDKDNNDFVAEAASSKFLRGRINMEDEYISIPESQFVPRGVPVMVSQRKAPTMGPKADIPTSVGKPTHVPNKDLKPVANAPKVSNNAPTKRVKPAALGLGSIAEYCGKERRLIVQSQCKRRKKRPVLRSCSGM